MELEQLLELTSSLSEPLASDEVARVVVDRSAATTGAPKVLMWTVDDPPTHATLVRSFGLEPEAQAGYARVPLEPRLPICDAILRREPRFFASLVLSYACLPLVVHGRAIGGVSIMFPGLRAFDADEHVFLTVLAHHAAQALERARLFEHEKATRQRLQSAFLGMLGHELRNPLAPIFTALHLMRVRGGPSVQRERAVIERHVGHLMRLVDDMLDMSLAVRGELRLERSAVEVASVVADAIEGARPLIEEHGHQLSVSVPRPGLLLLADAWRIAQVVTHLLTNAAKYTPSGGHISVVARADGDRVVLEVADDGAGIERELLPVVFDAFTQGRQGLDRKQGGLGLGLAIARQLVVAHGGTIEARSAGPGRGTTVVVRLPRVDAARRRVLLVDDNLDAAELLKDALTETGHEVRTAADAPSALQLVQTFTPDIAFLDIGLPVMDGYELARQLRSISSLANTPLVAVTGYVQDDDRRRAFASGFTEHLAKPLAPNQVIGCIEQLTGRRR
jgi:signal transduction histidine kinase/CheY-like chemotaxis protein